MRRAFALAALVLVPCVQGPGRAVAASGSAALTDSQIVELLAVKFANSKSSAAANASYDAKLALLRVQEKDDQLGQEVRRRQAAEARLRDARGDAAASRRDLEAARAQAAQADTELRLFRDGARGELGFDPALAAELAAYRQLMSRTLAEASPEKRAAWARFAQGDRGLAAPVLIELTLAENAARLGALDRLKAKAERQVAVMNAANLRPVAVNIQTMAEDGEISISSAIDLWLQLISTGGAGRLDHAMLASLYRLQEDDRQASVQERLALGLKNDPEVLKAFPDEARLTEARLGIAAGKTPDLLSLAQENASARDAAARRGLSALVKLTACVQKQGPAAAVEAACAEVDDIILQRLSDPAEAASEIDGWLNMAGALGQASRSGTIDCAVKPERVGCADRRIGPRAAFEAARRICVDAATGGDPRRAACAYVALVAAVRAPRPEDVAAPLGEATRLLVGVAVDNSFSSPDETLAAAATLLALLGDQDAARLAVATATSNARRAAVRPGDDGGPQVRLASALAAQARVEQEISSPAAAAIVVAALRREGEEIRARRPNSISICYALDDLNAVGLSLLEAGPSPDLERSLASAMATALACDELETFVRGARPAYTSTETLLGGYRMVSWARSDAGDSLEALAYAERSLSRGPDGEVRLGPGAYAARGTIQSLFNLASLRRDLGPPEAARTAFHDLIAQDRAVRDAPDASFAGDELLSPAALKQQVAKDYPAHLAMLGQFEEAQGDPAAALQAYEEVLALADPASWPADDAASFLGFWARDHGEPRRGVELFKRRVAFAELKVDASGHPSARLDWQGALQMRLSTLAEALEMVGDRGQALVQRRRAVEIGEAILTEEPAREGVRRKTVADLRALSLLIAQRGGASAETRRLDARAEVLAGGLPAEDPAPALGLDVKAGLFSK